MGQTQPQNARPKTRVSATVASAGSMSTTTVLAASMAVSASSGSMRKSRLTAPCSSSTPL